MCQGKTTSFSPGKRAFGTYALGCAVFAAMCYGAAVEETEEDQDANDIEVFVAFSIQSLEGVAILDGGATKTYSGFTSVEPVVDQYGDTTIEPTDVGFTFAGGETKAGAILPTGRLASEMMPSKSEQEQRPTSSHALSGFPLGPTTKGTGDRNAFA